MNENETPKKKHAGRRFMIIFLLVVLVFLPVSNGIGYEMVFHFMFLDTMRDNEKNEAEEAAFLEEHEILRMEYTIDAGKGKKLQGYLYLPEGTSVNALPKNMIVLSHGIGNGHIAYLPLIGELAELHDTAVFAYDATGCGRSDGKATGGLPLVMHGGSGLMDSDYREAIARGIRKVNYYTYGALAGGRGVYDIVKEKPDGLQFHDVAVRATDAIAADIVRVMCVFGGRTSR